MIKRLPRVANHAPLKVVTEDSPHTPAAKRLSPSCLMGKFRNGESTIDSVVKLTVFSVIPSRSISALLSITTVDRRDPRSARSCS